MGFYSKLAAESKDGRTDESMSFRVEVPPQFTPSIEAMEEEAKKAPWGTRLPALLEDLKRTRLHMITKYPFWAKLGFKMQLMFSEEVPTAAVRVDGITIFNPDFYEALSIEGKVFLLAHELCHLAFMHFEPHYLDGRDPARWNRAGDYMINATLMESGLKMPTDQDGKAIGLFEDRFKSMSTIEIYDILEKEDREQNRDGSGRKKGESGDGGRGSGPDDMMGGDCDFGATEELKKRSEDGSGRHVMSESEIKSDIISAVKEALSRGDAPAGLVRHVGAITEPVVPWEEILDRLLERNCGGEKRSHSKASRRSWSMTQSLRERGDLEDNEFLLLPGNVPNGGFIAYILDSSGSIGEEELKRIKGELVGILRRYPNMKIRQICCDAEVTSDKYVAEADEIEFKGGGGTAHVPVFDRLDGTDGVGDPEGNFRHPNAVILMTDGYTDMHNLAKKYPYGPPYNVFWVNIADSPFPDAPWGTVIERNPKNRKKQAAFEQPAPKAAKLSR